MKGRQHRDSLWKEVLHDFFPQFLEFFFPRILADLDLDGRGYEFLDKEFQSIVRKSRTGRRHADKLIKVHLRDGSETWLLIHVEVQGKEETGFEERLYIYNYRIFDRFRKEVVTLVVLADNSARFRPKSYETSRWGFSHTFTFPSVKLLDYRDKMAELEVSRNPFAVIVLAWLLMMESGKDEHRLFFWKVTLIKSLYCKGYGRDDIMRLYHFIDWLIELPEFLDKKCTEEIMQYEEAMTVPYVSSAERLGIKKGRAEGLQKGMEKGRAEGMEIGLEKGIEKGQKIEALKIGRELEARGMPVKEIAEITGLTVEEVEALTPD